MPTTARGIEYPNSAGHTRLWEHLQTMAEDVDAALTATEALRPKIKAGKQSLTFTGGSTATATVDYSAAGFSAPPAVFVTATNSNYFGFTGTPGTTSSTVGARINSGTSSSTLDIHWVAIGI